jgi:CHASE3 domain
LSAKMAPQDDKGEVRASPGLRINIIALSAAFILLLAILIVAAILALRQRSAQADVQRSINVINGLNRVLTGLLDAETGQRGYILTGDPSYLEPFNRAAPDVLGEVRYLQEATRTDGLNAASLTTLYSVAEQKLAELHETIALQQQGKHDAGRRQSPRRCWTRIHGSRPRDHRESHAGRNATFDPAPGRCCEGGPSVTIRHRRGGAGLLVLRS